MERGFGAAALLVALGTVAGNYAARNGGSWRLEVSVACLGMLICALLGMRTQASVGRLQRGELARVYRAALQGKRDSALDAPAGGGHLAWLLRSVAGTLRLALLPRDTLAREASDMGIELSRRSKDAARLAATMSEDAFVIGEAAAASRRAEADLANRLDGVRGRADSAAAASDALTEAAVQLTEAIRAVTAQTEQTTAIAARLSETAFATQRSVTAIGDINASLQATADQVRQVLQRAETLGLNAEIEAARAGEAGRGFSVVAAEVKALASAGGTALEAMLATVREAQAQAAQLFQRIQDMSDAIQAQHEFGHALSHASMLQGDAVSRLLRQLGVAQNEVRELHTEAHGMLLPEVRLGAGAMAEQAVERLPGYAEAMAQILRGLPDFAVGERAWERTPPG